MPAHQPLAPETLEAFDQAQRGAIQALRRVLGQLREGLSEKDVVELARTASAEQGFTEWYHEPEVRFGGTLDRLHRPRADRLLTPGTLVEIDLGPGNDVAYGDVGVALAWGTSEEPALVRDARELLRATCGFASRWKTVGELFVFAQAWTVNRRMSLGDAKAVGHVCLAREGFADLAWPEAARAATFMRRNQIQWYNPRRMAGIYAVRPRLVGDGQALAFEEMIYIDGDVKRVLGRASLDEAGLF